MYFVPPFATSCLGIIGLFKHCFSYAVRCQQPSMSDLIPLYKNGPFWPISETPFKWRFAGGPIVAREYMLAGQ